MAMATFPLNIYATRNIFNDYGADDMRYGDMTEQRLKNEFHLIQISNRVDPYSMTRLSTFNNPQSRFAGVYNHRPGPKLSPQECARLLFEEMQVTSLPFAFVGPQRTLINKMLDHFMQSSGAPFRHMLLDIAYQERILNDTSANSTRKAIIQVIDENIDYKNGGFPQHRLGEFKSLINTKILPKFDSLIMDNFNGLGITVHDVHATKIDIMELVIKGRSWHARVRYTGQDHFGIDVNDIRKQKFRQFQLFRIWFILQRYQKFGFRPFLTNMEATIDMKGSLV
ncbi:DUF3289 family protein [Pantoea cypripedii]|uniref:DUF3289 domain-containing protein n=1 Tax=Pantoea cypripedii TaxID=55209 RepID=A0A6B9G213_PANCY|nr:DUF3289 family protein [Pantoea cypripedii]QGY30868.1 hypothetical protein CUN67_18825 [Pantoea cypripedii]